MSGSRAADALVAERAAAAERLEALVREFDHLVEVARDANADDEHDPEGATLGYERAQVSALIAQARAQLDDVEAAQQRLTDGSYGRCAVCGGPVGEERLAARPTARECVRCAAARATR